jgi:cytochrome c-type biogenesis protein CcmH
MIVWLLILLLAAAAFVALRYAGRLDWSTLRLVGAGLCLAIAGYAWQGHPSLAGKPGQAAVENERTRIGGETFAVLRRHVLGQFDQASRWLGMADSYLAQGDSLRAAQILRSGIREHPRDPDLWIGLGNALFLHSGAKITPASEFAFDRAQQLAPGNPAPLFFRGMAFAQAGGFAEAEQAWRQTLALTPPGTSWRPLVEERLQLVRQLVAMQEMRQSMSNQSQTNP